VVFDFPLFRENQMPPRLRQNAFAFGFVKSLPEEAFGLIS
jgi:hypothetical protein